MEIAGERQPRTVAVEIASAVVLWTVLASLVVPGLVSRPATRSAAMGRVPAAPRPADGGGPTPSPTGEALRDAGSIPTGGVDAVIARLHGGGDAAAWPRADGGRTRPVPGDEGDARVARRFLAEREEVPEGLRPEARGYWENSYLPRDPGLRWLRAQVSMPGGPGSPVGRAHPPALSMDMPEGAALAVSLDADRRRVTDRGRVLVRLGIQGTSRRAGRSGTAVALVVDLRGSLDAADEAQLSGLWLALARRLDSMDRLFLVAAGPGGGVVMEPGEERRGGKPPAFASSRDRGPDAGLVEAFAAAGRRLDAEGRRGERPRRVAILAMRGPAEADARELAELAHLAGLAGITTSVLALPGASSEEGDLIALAGQGRRVDASTSEGIEAFVRSELEVAGDEIARAIHIGFRLAPGVELLGVLGSRRLSRADGQAPPDGALTALAAEIGIPRERRPSDAVEIFIPSFHAGHGHAVLLDLVVPGPGDVVEATVAYQDRVWMKPGLQIAHLALPRDAPDDGPLQASVRKWLLAHHLRLAFDGAAESVAAGRREEAVESLEWCAALVRGLPFHCPALHGDAELAADLALIEALAQQLREPGDGVGAATSLRYSARVKVQRPPADGEGA